MKITKKQLKQIIKEELEAVMAGAESFPGDGKTPVLSPDELGLEGGGMIAEVGVGTITLGVVLGIAAWKGVGLVATAAKSILGGSLRLASRAANNLANDLANQIKAAEVEKAQEILNQVATVLDADEELNALAAEYHKLTDQVRTPHAGDPGPGSVWPPRDTSPNPSQWDMPGVKGARGPWPTAIRKRQKEVAYKFAEAVKAAVSSAIQDVAPDGSAPDRLAQDVVRLARKHARRRR